ncbi:MAG: acyltransferase family protein [Lachnospiraceae bacterium]
MRTIFRLNAGKIFALIFVMLVALIITANFHYETPTTLGKTRVKSGTAYTYLKEVNLTLTMPGDYRRYFSDAKNKDVLKYLEENHLYFVATPSGDNGYELGLRVNAFDDLYQLPEGITDLSQLGESEKAKLRQAQQHVVQSVNSPYTYEKAEPAEAVELLGHTFYHYYFARSAAQYKYYENVSCYLGVLDGNVIEVMIATGQSKPWGQLSGDPYLQECERRVLNTLQIGDMTGAGDNEAESSFANAWKRISSFQFSLWILLLPVGFVMLGNTKVAREYGVWQEDFTGLQHSKSILGLSAVLIEFHHLVQRVGVNAAGALAFLENAGVNFVGLFFFYSGYGLYTSSKTKPDYFRGFFRKRLPGVLVPTYLVIVIFTLCNILIEKEPITLDVLRGLLGIRLVNDHMWYIVEICLLYFLFWICLSKIKNEKVALSVLGVLIALLVVGSLCLGHGSNWFQGEWWYNTTFVFYLGILFAGFGNRMLPWLKKHYKTVLVCSVIIFAVLYQGTAEMLEHVGYWTEYAKGGKCLGDKFLTLSVQLPMVISFVWLVLMLGMKVQIGNRVLTWLGNISLELYLIHNLFLKYFSGISGVGIYCFFVLAASLLAATLLHMVDTALLCKIRKKPLPKYSIDVGAPLRYLAQVWKRFRMYLRDWRRHPRKRLRILFREMVCIFLSLISIYPVYEMAINATQNNVVGGFQLLPGTSFLKYVREINSMFQEAGGDLYHGIFISTVISVSAALLATYFGAMTAYAFEKYDFKGKKYLWWGILACMFIPQATCFAGYYKLILAVNMTDNLLPVILPAMATPSAVYLIRMYLKNVSIHEIAEAARIDGAGELRIFNQIILPMLQPVLVLQLMFSFVTNWNNAFAQTLLLVDWRIRSAVSYVGVVAGGNGAGNDPHTYALLLVTALPSILVYLFCSKSIVSNITLGAIKE